MIGWVIFLVLFGWLFALAIILVLGLVLCACLINFIATGRCDVMEDEEEEGEREAIRGPRGRQRDAPPSRYAGTAQ